MSHCRSTATSWVKNAGDGPVQLDEWGKVAFMEAPLPDDDSELAAEFARLASAPFVERTLTLGGAFAFPADNGTAGDHMASAERSRALEP